TRPVMLLFVYLAGACERGLDVTDVTHHFLRLACGLEQRLFVGFRCEARVLTRVPHNLQLLAALHRRPGIVGNPRDATQRLEGIRWFGGFEPDRLLYTAHLPCFLVVERL